MVGQQGFWDEAERLAKLTRKKPSLERLKAAIPWEEFRPLLERAFAKERKSPAGRKRIDVIVMFKMLVLQQLHNLSDAEVEFQVNDRRSFEKFVGLDVMHSIPDGTTVALFREQLRQAGIFEELFQKFDAYLDEQGLRARGGQIIDATIVPVPKQRNRRKENEEIKQGKVPEDWQGNSNRLRQKDLDARWTKKNGLNIRRCPSQEGRPHCLWSGTVPTAGLKRPDFASSGFACPKLKGAMVPTSSKPPSGRGFQGLGTFVCKPQKNGVSHYGYKNSISIDAAYGLIRRHVLTPCQPARQPNASGPVGWQERRCHGLGRLRPIRAS